MRPLASTKVQEVSQLLQGVDLTLRGHDGGVQCWHVPQLVLLHSRFWTGIVPQGWTVPRLPCMRCWGIPVTSCEPLSLFLRA